MLTSTTTTSRWDHGTSKAAQLSAITRRQRRLPTPGQSCTDSQTNLRGKTQWLRRLPATGAQPAETQAPADTPTPTQTPAPTAAPEPTATPVPTATQAFTPSPTPTPEPTPTPRAASIGGSPGRRHRPSPGRRNNQDEQQGRGMCQPHRVPSHASVGPTPRPSKHME